MKTVIHVNKHIISKNKKSEEFSPPLTCKNRIGNEKAKEVAILGPSKVGYRPDKPLSCGAVCWVETHSDILTGSEAEFYCNSAPDVQANFHLTPIGYQMDILVNGKKYLSECRDFGGNAKVKKLTNRVCDLLEQIAETIRKEN